MHRRLELAARRGLALLPREASARYYGEKTQQRTTDGAEPRWRNRHGGALLAGAAAGQHTGHSQDDCRVGEK